MSRNILDSLDTLFSEKKLSWLIYESINEELVVPIRTPKYEAKAKIELSTDSRNKNKKIYKVT